MNALRTSRRLAVPLFLALTLALALGFLRAFAPSRPPSRAALAAAMDSTAMDAAMAPAAVSNHLAAILARGSRFHGQPGCAQTRDDLRAAFANAGLELLELPNDTLAPVTARRDILGADGAPLAGVEIFPFMPNHLQPAVTPPGGLAGELLLVTDEMLRTRARFDDAIAVIDCAAPPDAFGLDWTAYARAGFLAVIVAHRGGLDAMRWGEIGAMRASVPVNFVRLAASAEIFNHLGEPATLHVRQTWQSIADTTLVGILPAPEPAREAVVVPVCTDAPSVLPDRAPGTLAAVQIAIQRALLDGIRAYRDDPARTRDVIFVAYPSRMMALQQVDALTSVLGPAHDRGSARARLVADAAAIKAARQGPQLEDAARYVLDTIQLELAETQLATRVAFLREGGMNTQGAAFAAYRAAKQAADEAAAMANLPLARLMEDARGSAFAARVGLQERIQARLDQLARFRIARGLALESALALHDRFARYDRLVAVGALLAPGNSAAGGESCSFYMGTDIEALAPRQGPAINDVTQAVQAQEAPGNARFLPLQGRDHGARMAARIAGLPVDVTHWNLKGYPAFVLVNTDRAQAYQAFGAPIDLPALHNLDSLRGSLRVMGRTLLALACGAGQFLPPEKQVLTPYSGRVVAANIGSTLIPDYPLQGAILGHKGPTGAHEQPGYYLYPFLLTDPEGRYDLAPSSLPMLPPAMPYSPEVMAFGADGLPRFVKDDGPLGQQVFKSINVGAWGDRRNINIVAFRGAPVALFDVINPQSLKPYTGYAFLRQDNLIEIPRRNVFGPANGIVAAFLPPDARFCVALKAGAPENDKVQTTRAFLLGADGEASPGYLTADTPVLREIARDSAAALRHINDARLQQQTRGHMADERTRAFAKRSREFLSLAAEPGIARRDAERHWRAATTYGMLNHPVLRENVQTAIVGILWYLGLLVPFVFVAEKLLFGCADIRRQLAAQLAIFLAVFLLLRWLHPAFGMIRSGLMILLGFVILLITVGVTVLFAGRFRAALADVARRRGRAPDAEAGTLALLGAALMLGLNNMRRRRVRTGLTCATLVLLTTAMICFTAISSDLVDRVVPVGRAAYAGLLIKPDDFAPMSDAELLALRQRFEPAGIATPRRMLVGVHGADRVNYNADLEVVHAPPDGSAPKRQSVSTLLELGPHEPLRSGLRMVAGSWFTEAVLTRADHPPPVLIPDTLAAALGVTCGARGVAINGREVVVRGIFEAQSLANLRDLDGRDVLPFDAEALRTTRLERNRLLAEPGAPRLRAEATVIVPADLKIPFSRGDYRLVSVAVPMPGVPYRAAREIVDQYLEQSGQTAYFGLQDTAWRGRRARASWVSGVAELVVPLILAALTVLNTMRGSVYERRDEIFVYNAVGIAPRYVFAMFLTEAFVYGVIGVVLGFILSQGAGRALLALDWTGGMDMNFASRNAIYASLAILGAVLLSSVFPARAAMRLAAPVDEPGWKLPEPQGDGLTFALPFVFDARDRVAVLAFFGRYLADHGEGSSGRFFAGVPRFETDAQGPVPQLGATVWLKPFDLGVSQDFAIAMPRDPATGEFVAEVRLRLRSGSREAWLRLNHAFVAQVRRQALYWRAVDAELRGELFEEGRKHMDAASRSSALQAEVLGAGSAVRA